MANNEDANNNDCMIVGGKDVWPERVKAHLLDLMIEEVMKGNKITSTFSRLGWSNIKDGLKSKFNKLYADEQLKNKFNQFRRTERDFKKIVSETGVGYTAATGKVDASDDRWEKWSKTTKGITSFRKNGCPEYEKLSIIFGATTATGGGAFASTREVSDSSDEQSKEQDEDVAEPSVVAKEPKGKAISKGKKMKASKSTYSTAVEKAIIGMAEEAKRKNDFREIAHANSSVRGPMNEATSHDKEADVLTECMLILDDMEVDGDIFVKALDVLHDCPLKRVLFLRMTENRRKEWLQKFV